MNRKQVAETKGVHFRLLSKVSLLSCLLLGVLLYGPAYADNDADLVKLIKHIDELWRGETSHATMQMQVKTSRYQRDMTMEAWSRDTDYSLVTIRNPVKDRGISTLKVKQNIWNYLPKIGRVIKVPSSMMSGSWMGSHFTNDDLVRESSFTADYSTSMTFQGERNARQIYELTAIPKPDAAVVWGKVVLTIDKQTMAPLKILDYDEANRLVRTMVLDQFKRIANKVVPMRMTLNLKNKPGESTTITYKDIEFGVPLEPSFFSLQNLRNRR